MRQREFEASGQDGSDKRRMPAGIAVKLVGTITIAGALVFSGCESDEGSFKYCPAPEGTAQEAGGVREEDLAKFGFEDKGDVPDDMRSRAEEAFPDFAIPENARYYTLVEGVGAIGPDGTGRRINMVTAINDRGDFCLGYAERQEDTGTIAVSDLRYEDTGTAPDPLRASLILAEANLQPPHEHEQGKPMTVTIGGYKDGEHPSRQVDLVAAFIPKE